MMWVICLPMTYWWLPFCIVGTSCESKAFPGMGATQTSSKVVGFWTFLVQLRYQRILHRDNARKWKKEEFTSLHLSRWDAAASAPVHSKVNIIHICWEGSAIVVCFGSQVSQPFIASEAMPYNLAVFCCFFSVKQERLHFASHNKCSAVSYGYVRQCMTIQRHYTMV
jgi:hypothetical protein